MSEPRMRPVWVSTDPDNGLIGYWLDMEIAAPWRPQAKPPAHEMSDAMRDLWRAILAIGETP